jgi:hypothetical protein
MKLVLGGGEVEKQFKLLNLFFFLQKFLLGRPEESKAYMHHRVKQT